MYRIIGADGREYGPIPAEQLRQWIREGRADAQTRARAEGARPMEAAGGVCGVRPAAGADSSAAGRRGAGLPRTAAPDQLDGHGEPVHGDSLAHVRDVLLLLRDAV